MNEHRAPTPRVSVVMPVLNGEAYIAEAIESVLDQTYGDLELVVVDDGSQDTSRSIAEHFAGADPRVRLLVNDRNLGISAALNRGWGEARGAYIARLDADDVALPARISRQVEFLDRHPSVAVVGGNAIVIDSTGRRVSTLRFPSDSRVIRSTLLRHNCLAHPSVMLRRTALEAAGGYRFDHVEDYDLWLRLSERFELANLSETLILHRLHVGQISFLLLEEQVKRALAVRTAARARNASEDDPLAGMTALTPLILDRMNLDGAELARDLEVEWLSQATMFAELGRREDAEELIAQASRTLSSRATRAFAAATELRRAEALLGSGRPIAGAWHLFLAFCREPRYAFRRLRTWLADHLGRRDLPRQQAIVGPARPAA